MALNNSFMLITESFILLSHTQSHKSSCTNRGRISIEPLRGLVKKKKNTFQFVYTLLTLKESVYKTHEKEGRKEGRILEGVFLS